MFPESSSANGRVHFKCPCLVSRRCGNYVMRCGICIESQLGLGLNLVVSQALMEYNTWQNPHKHHRGPSSKGQVTTRAIFRHWPWNKKSTFPGHFLEIAVTCFVFGSCQLLMTPLVASLTFPLLIAKSFYCWMLASSAG